MGSTGRDVAAGRAPAGPLPRTPAQLDDALLVDALARLAGADSSEAACDAVLPLLLDVADVRAAAVVLRDRTRVVIVGSAGYGCGPMSAGADLPLDAGLPVTEAVRTGRTVVQGTGPSWVATPFGNRAGALLLSLTGPPPQAPSQLARLQRLARTLGDVLQRTTAQVDTAAALAVVSGRLAAPPAPPDVAVRSTPHQAPAGGDVALCLPDGRGGRWLVVADVCGCGLAAAVTGRAVHATFTALAPYVDSPAALLAAADAALRAADVPDLFVTALVVHERDGRVRAASAGHPPLMLLREGGVTTVELDPGLPLVLADGPAPERADADVEIPPDAVLLLHSDGLVDRRDADGATVSADAADLVAGLRLDDLEALADDLLAAAGAVGAAGDDVTLLLARPLG